jgi:cyclophilin family peptidyl-prolyl cis-trans isomerase
MNSRYLLALFLLSSVLLAGCASNDGSAVAASRTAVMLVKMRNERRPQRVVIALREDAAPGTVGNFKQLVARHYYDGMRFHRIFPHRLVQTGDPKSRHGESERSGTGGPGYTVPAEIRLKHERGAVAASRLPDGVNPTRSSNGSQFYVCLEPLPSLDGQYTVFGRVTEGLEILEAISQIPANSNDFPVQNVVIQSIRLE